MRDARFVSKTSRNGLRMTALAVVLCSALAFLYSKTQEKHKTDYFENLAMLQQMKQLDTEWELLVLKSRGGTTSQYEAVAGSLAELRQSFERFASATAAQKHEDTLALAQYNAALRDTIDAKAELIEDFKLHNSALRNALMTLSVAAEELRHSVPPPGQETDEAQIRVVIGANTLLMESLLYRLAPSESKAAELRAKLDSLLSNKPFLDAAAADKLSVFGSRVSTIIREQATVNRLLEEISAVPTARLFNAIDADLARERQRADAQVQHYRRYLLVFSVFLISLLLYATLRVIRSHAEINRVNDALRKANEGLEQRVQERTQELASSNAVLNTTLESSTDAIFAYRFGTNAICYNSLYQKMWDMPERLLKMGENNAERLEWIAAQTVDPERFLARQAELVRRREMDVFDLIELKDGRILERYIKPQCADGKALGVVVNLRDITARRRAERELETAHKQLLEVSRQAGMAEVATGVLHNVGNVLTSVNVSAGLIAETAGKSKVSSLVKLVALLEEHKGDLAAFITTNPKGRHLTGFLTQLCQQLLSEQRTVLQETESLRSNIDHVKQIVAVQQNYSKVSGLKELVNAVELIEGALRINAAALQRHGVRVVREFAETPDINTQKHKVLQILVNLVQNAKYACSDAERSDKCIVLRMNRDGNRLRIAVSDNGVGIAPENLTRIFSHGFTTRKDGHGFGLHSGALAARELGGSLSVYSDGLGTGATFVLELPLEARDELHAAPPPYARST